MRSGLKTNGFLKHCKSFLKLIIIIGVSRNFQITIAFGSCVFEVAVGAIVFFIKIEGLIPPQLRRAVVLHGSYLIHRSAVKYGAVRFTEWGNIQQTAWFVQEIDAAYDSNYELFSRSGVATSLWWAAMRGLKDGKQTVY